MEKPETARMPTGVMSVRSKAECVKGLSEAAAVLLVHAI